MPSSIAVVPLDELVVYQRQINLRYTAQLGSLLGNPTLESDQIFKFCLSIDQPDPPIISLQTGLNSFVFSSGSTDARFLEARLVDAANIGGHTAQGRPTSAVVIYIGYGVNAISVLSTYGSYQRS